MRVLASPTAPFWLPLPCRPCRTSRCPCHTTRRARRASSAMCRSYCAWGSRCGRMQRARMRQWRALHARQRHSAAADDHSCPKHVVHQRLGRGGRGASDLVPRPPPLQVLHGCKCPASMRQPPQLPLSAGACARPERVSVSTYACACVRPRTSCAMLLRVA